MSRIRSTVGRNRNPDKYPYLSRDFPVTSSPLGAVAIGSVAKSRVRVGEGLVRAKYLRLSEEASGQPRLSEEQAIERAKSKLDTPGIRGLYDKYGSFRYVLGGAPSELTLADGAFVPLGRARGGRGYDTARHGAIPGRNGFSKAWETGVNVGALVEGRPNDRYKFYFSLDATTPRQQERTVQFMQQIHERAAESNIAMLTKIEDHTYDNCDLYTWSPVEMAGILRDLYPEYPDIWSSTEHPLQGDISGIDPMHIGFVQEPIGGLNGCAHSARMGKLGAALDAGANFEEACASASVLPEAPWVVDPEALVV